MAMSCHSTGLLKVMATIPLIISYSIVTCATALLRSSYLSPRCQKLDRMIYLTVFHAQLINVHLQNRLDTYFNKDTHRTVLYFLVYDQDKGKQKDCKNVMSFRGIIGIYRSTVSTIS